MAWWSISLALTLKGERIAGRSIRVAARACMCRPRIFLLVREFMSLQQLRINGPAEHREQVIGGMIDLVEELAKHGVRIGAVRE